MGRLLVGVSKEVPASQSHEAHPEKTRRSDRVIYVRSPCPECGHRFCYLVQHKVCKIS